MARLIGTTIGAALDEARRALASVSETASLDAQLLLAQSIGTDRTWILAHPEAPLAQAYSAGFRRGVERCARGEALPYVLGWWEFYGRRFQVTRDVLIPRPETEGLVEAAVRLLRTRPGPWRCADVGTGSGCIAITLAIECPTARIMATDISMAALRLARVNGAHHAVGDRVRFVRCDLLRGIRGSFDLVCANLPYVPSESLDGLLAAKREPRVALDGGPDGQDPIRRLLADLPGLLAPSGVALLEIEARQGLEALAAARLTLPDAQVRLAQDLAGRDRLLVVRRDPTGQ